MTIKELAIPAIFIVFGTLFNAVGIGSLPRVVLYIHMYVQRLHEKTLKIDFRSII
jgi:hypothetical protein